MNFECILKQKISNGKFQIFNIISCGLAISVYGCYLTTITIIIPMIVNELNLCNKCEMLLMESSLIGRIFGSIFAGYLSDKYGRLITAKIGLVLFLVFELLLTVSNQYVTLIMFINFSGFTANMIMIPAITLIGESIDQ